MTSKIFDGKTPVMFLDQNNVHGGWFTTLKDMELYFGKRATAKIYVDKEDGPTFHCGYIFGKRWLTAYVPREAAA